MIVLLAACQINTDFFSLFKTPEVPDNYEDFSPTNPDGNIVSFEEFVTHSTFSREYIAKVKSRYELRLLETTADFYFVDYAYNDERISSQYADGYFVDSGEGGISGEIGGVGSFAKKKGTPLRTGEYYVYITTAETFPGKGDAWYLSATYYKGEGWKIDNCYFDQEETLRMQTEERWKLWWGIDLPVEMETDDLQDVDE
jgi:hypothetical protein